MSAHASDEHRPVRANEGSSATGKIGYVGKNGFWVDTKRLQDDQRYRVTYDDVIYQISKNKEGSLEITEIFKTDDIVKHRRVSKRGSKRLSRFRKRKGFKTRRAKHALHKRMAKV